MKSTHSTLFSLIIITLVTNVCFSNGDQQDIFKTTLDVIQVDSKLQLRLPLTFWIFLQFENQSVPERLHEVVIQLTSPLIIGSNFGEETPIRKHIHLNSFYMITELLCLGSTQEVLTFADDLLTSGNKKRDRFLFLGPFDTLMQFMRIPKIQGLGDKVGVATDTPNTILVEPRDFEAGVILTLSDISQRLSYPKMGEKLHGRYFKIAGSPLPPWYYVDETVKPVRMDGANYRLVQAASEKFNFTFEVKVVSGGYGNQLPNGTWVGGVSNLYYTERQFEFVIYLGHVLSWYHFVDFLNVMDFARLQFSTSHPSITVGWNAFILPYNPRVWLTMICFYVFTILNLFTVLVLTAKSDGFVQYFYPKAKPLTTTQIFNKSFWIPYHIALEQSLTKIPLTVRYIGACWMIGTIVTGTSYRSNLASYLSFPTVLPKPTTFEDLASREDYKVNLNNLGVAEQNFFENSDSPAVVKMRKRLGLIPDPYECLTASLVEPKTACIAWTPLSAAYAYEALTLNPHLEPLQYSSVPILFASMTLGFVKNSIFVDSFFPISYSLYESGIYERWIQEVYYFFKVKGRDRMKNATESLAYAKLKEYEESVGALKGSVKPFTMKNFKLPFCFIIAGLIMSTLVFLGEEIYIKIFRRLFKSKTTNAEAAKIKVRPCEVAKKHLGNIPVHLQHKKV